MPTHPSWRYTSICYHHLCHKTRKLMAEFNSKRNKTSVSSKENSCSERHQKKNVAQSNKN